MHPKSFVSNFWGAVQFRYGFLFVLTVYLLLFIVVDLPFFAFASSLYLKLRFR